MHPVIFSGVNLPLDNFKEDKFSCFERTYMYNYDGDYFVDVACGWEPLTN
jgi:hypothetical protein